MIDIESYDSASCERHVDYPRGSVYNSSSKLVWRSDAIWLRNEVSTFGGVSTMNCALCNREISEERLQALPNTKVCVNCSHDHTVRDVDGWLGPRPVEHKSQHAKAGRGASSYEIPR